MKTLITAIALLSTSLSVSAEDSFYAQAGLSHKVKEFFEAGISNHKNSLKYSIGAVYTDKAVGIVSKVGKSLNSRNIFFVTASIVKDNSVLWDSANNYAYDSSRIVGVFGVAHNYRVSKNLFIQSTVDTQKQVKVSLGIKF